MYNNIVSISSKTIISVALQTFQSVKYIRMLLPFLLDLKRENEVLWAKLDWYRKIEAKELGKT